eukprot:402897_1
MFTRLRKNDNENNNESPQKAFRSLSHQHMCDVLNAMMHQCKKQEYECKEYDDYHESIRPILCSSFNIQMSATSKTSLEPAQKHHRNKSSMVNRSLDVDRVTMFVMGFADQICDFVVDKQEQYGIVSNSSQFPMDTAKFKQSLDKLRSILITQKNDTAEERTRSLPLAGRVSAYVSAYDTLIVTASLVFSFAVSLAAENASEENFESVFQMYLFNILIIMCIVCGLHSISILSLVNYNANRYLGSGLTDNAADFIESTYQYRNHGRISFTLCLILFILSLCVLFFEGLPTSLAVINTTIAVLGILVVLISLKKMKRS